MALESIALIPSGYKATKVYSQLPVNGNGDFTFDRGTSADQTRVNKNGLIESVAVDVPRLDYLDGGCPSLLLEPSSTNLITYSEEFDNAYWTKSAGSVSANSSLSPDGSVNADAFTENTATDVHVFFRNNIAITASSTYSVSVFVKSNSTTRNIMIRTLDSLTNVETTFFDLSTATFVSNSSAYEPSVVDYGNGWYRITQTRDDDSGGGDVDIQIGFANGETISYTGDGVNSAYFFGTQLEEQSYATSYMPSLSGVSGVRAAETCNGAGTTAEINSQEGVLFFEGRALADDLTSRKISLNSGSSTNQVTLSYTTTTNTLRSIVYDGAIRADFSHSLVDILSDVKMAVKYKDGDFSLWVNGLEVGSSNGTIGTLSLNNLSFDSGSSEQFYGRVKKLSVYDQALSTTELETLTGFTSFAEMATYLSYS